MEKAGKDGLSSYFRLGLFTHRVAMIFSMLRYEDKKIPDIIECTDVDFELALTVSSLIKEHTIDILESIPSNGSESFKNSQQKEFYRSLPSGEFRTSDGFNVAKRLGIAEKTAENYLSDLSKKAVLKRPKHGWYLKPLKRSG